MNTLLGLGASLMMASNAVSDINPEFSGKTISISVVEVTDQPPLIDGVISEAFWQQATVVDDFHQAKPEEFERPSQRTEVRIAKDNDSLYIAAKMFDDTPAEIKANEFIQGNDTDADDQFHVVLDTFKNTRNGYFFQLNPNGIRNEALITNSSSDDDWTTIWQGEASITENGWELEMAIPFKSLSFSPDQSEWGINFGRVIRRNQEIIAWSSEGADSWEMAPIVAGSIDRMTDMNQGRGLDIAASMVSRAVSGESAEFKPSVDIFYRPTPELTWATTFNTDFSATEVDDRVVNLSRFSVFLPEKRDFFLQDTHLFRFGNLRGNGMPFFSRRIGLGDDGLPLDIDVGTKLTGRLGEYEYGVLAVKQDSAFGGETITVARGSRNMGERSRVGMLYTDGDPVRGVGNRVYGADFNYQNNDFMGDKTLRSNAWVLNSDDGELGSDQAWGVTLDYPNDAVSIRSSFTEIGEGYSPSLGFVNRSGIRQARLNMGRRFRFSDQWINRVNLWSNFRRVTDLDGNKLSSDYRIWPVNIGSESGDFMSIGVFDHYENLDESFEIIPDLTIPDGEYRFRRYRVFMESAESRPLSFRAVYTTGEFLNGERDDMEFGVDWRPMSRLLLSASTIQSELDLDTGSGKTRLHRFRSEFAINSDWAWLNNFQYDNISRQLGVNSRLRWIPRAGQSMYLVLNQTHLNLDSWEKQDEELSLKLSYTWRF